MPLFLFYKNINLLGLCYGPFLLHHLTLIALMLQFLNRLTWWTRISPYDFLSLQFTMCNILLALLPSWLSPGRILLFRIILLSFVLDISSSDIFYSNSNIIIQDPDHIWLSLFNVKLIMHRILLGICELLRAYLGENAFLQLTGHNHFWVLHTTYQDLSFLFFIKCLNSLHNTETNNINCVQNSFIYFPFI